MRSFCPTMISEMSLSIWDLDTFILTTHQESSENQAQANLESAAWYKDAFEDLSPATKGGLKKPTPPPETLFNLDKDCTVKIIHLCNEKRPPPAGSTTRPRKLTTKIVRLTGSDEDSASSSGDEWSCFAATKGDDDALSSSDGVNGQAQDLADGG
jgi:hypothetical protein